LETSGCITYKGIITNTYLLLEKLHLKHKIDSKTALGKFQLK